MERILTDLAPLLKYSIDRVYKPLLEVLESKIYDLLGDPLVCELIFPSEDYNMDSLLLEAFPGRDSQVLAGLQEPWGVKAEIKSI